MVEEMLRDLIIKSTCYNPKNKKKSISTIYGILWRGKLTLLTYLFFSMGCHFHNTQVDQLIQLSLRFSC